MRTLDRGPQRTAMSSADVDTRAFGRNLHRRPARIALAGGEAGVDRAHRLPLTEADRARGVHQDRLDLRLVKAPRSDDLTEKRYADALLLLQRAKQKLEAEKRAMEMVSGE